MEDDMPRARSGEGQGLGHPLDRFGLHELSRYVDALRAEILRVEAEMARKRGIADAASSVFRKPG